MIKSLSIFLFCLIGFYSCDFSNVNSNKKQDNNQENGTLSEQSFDILNPCSDEIYLDELGWYFYDVDTIIYKKDNDTIEINCNLYFTDNKSLYDLIEFKNFGDFVSVSVKNDSSYYKQGNFVAIRYEKIYNDKFYCYLDNDVRNQRHDTIVIQDTTINGLKVNSRTYVNYFKDSVNQCSRHFIICNEQEKLSISFMYRQNNSFKFLKYDLLKEIFDKFVVRRNLK